MEKVVNRSAPSIGVALAYFIIVLYAVPNGYILEDNQVEAVAMGSIVLANIVMEFKSFITWAGSLFKKEE